MNDLAKYYDIRDMMKTGDGLGFANTGLISNLIMWKTKGDANPINNIRLSHWGGLVRAGAYEGAECRRYTIEAMSIGFYPDILSDYIKDYPGHIYWYPLKDSWEPYRDKIGAQILSMIGVKYDWLGVTKQALLKVSANARRLFCSEAWQIGLQMTAPQLCAPIDKALTPTGMWRLGCFKTPVKLI
ncbi:MAG: hypothetical protein ABFD50_17830 [Smithella sp.]